MAVKLYPQFRILYCMVNCIVIKTLVRQVFCLKGKIKSTDFIYTCAIIHNYILIILCVIAL